MRLETNVRQQAEVEAAIDDEPESSRAVLRPSASTTSRWRDGRILAGRAQVEVGMGFTRVTVDPAQIGGMPCIRGLWIPVATVVSMVVDGMTVEEILTELPSLQADDVAEVLRYASASCRCGGAREAPLRHQSVSLLLVDALQQRPRRDPGAGLGPCRRPRIGGQ